MQPSPESNIRPGQSDGQTLAVAAEALYVTNLLLLPAIGFIVLLYLYIRHHESAPALARNHLEQTVHASLWIAAFFSFIAVTVVVLNRMGTEEMSLWMLVVITFTCVHATMVLLGVVGLAKAMAGKSWRYPVIGRPIAQDPVLQDDE